MIHTHTKYRVTYEGSPWGIQSWDKEGPAQGQVDALNKVLNDRTHYIEIETIECEDEKCQP